MMTLYLYISHHQSAPPATVLMPAWVPFLPVFILPYLAMLLMTWFMPAAIGDRRYFRACLLANLCGYLLVMPWWIITPTTLPRPPLPDGLWAEAVGLLWAIDKPDNVMPCAHGVGPVVVAWFLYRTHPRWLWPMVIALLIGLPSIALTWQHRPIDILLGTLAATIGITVSEALLRYTQSVPQGRPEVATGDQGEPVDQELNLPSPPRGG